MDPKILRMLGIVGVALLVGAAPACERHEEDASDEGARAQPADQGGAIQAPVSRRTPGGANHGPSANASQFALHAPDTPVAVGKKERVEFAITPAHGLKINLEYPWAVEFSGSDGVQLAQKSVSKAQIELAEDAATIPVLLEASAAGVHDLEATGSFSVCNDAKCWVMRDEPLTFQFKAQKAQAKSAQERPSKQGQEP